MNPQFFKFVPLLGGKSFIFTGYALIKFRSSVQFVISTIKTCLIS